MDAAMKDGIELMLRGDSHYSRELSDRGAEFLYEALVTPHLERPEAPTKETPEP